LLFLPAFVADDTQVVFGAAADASAGLHLHQGRAVVEFLLRFPLTAGLQALLLYAVEVMPSEYRGLGTGAAMGTLRMAALCASLVVMSAEVAARRGTPPLSGNAPHLQWTDYSLQSLAGVRGLFLFTGLAPPTSVDSNADLRAAYSASTGTAAAALLLSCVALCVIATWLVARLPVETLGQQLRLWASDCFVATPGVDAGCSSHWLWAWSSPCARSRLHAPSRTSVSDSGHVLVELPEQLRRARMASRSNAVAETEDVESALIPRSETVRLPTPARERLRSPTATASIAVARTLGASDSGSSLELPQTTPVAEGYREPPRALATAAPKPSRKPGLSSFLQRVRTQRMLHPRVRVGAETRGYLRVATASGNGAQHADPQTDDALVGSTDSPTSHSWQAGDFSYRYTGDSGAGGGDGSAFPAAPLEARAAVAPATPLAEESAESSRLFHQADRLRATWDCLHDTVQTHDHSYAGRVAAATRPAAAAAGDDHRSKELDGLLHDCNSLLRQSRLHARHLHHTLHEVEAERERLSRPGRARSASSTSALGAAAHAVTESDAAAADAIVQRMQVLRDEVEEALLRLQLQRRTQAAAEAHASGGSVR
jgi:hypothetical protein